jgi:hypothetical protein
MRDFRIWFARVPMIYYWIVAWHYPDRVMRQLGYYQSIPPPPPHSWTELQRLNKFTHGGRTIVDWRNKHAQYVEKWHPERIVETYLNEQRYYDESTYMDYRRWFQENGLYTVLIRGQVTTTGQN